jgi:hypothetical protein
VKRKRKISSEKLVWSIENYVFTQVTKNVFFPKKKKYGNIECLDIHPKKYSDFPPSHDLIFRKQTQEILHSKWHFQLPNKNNMNVLSLSE